MATNPYTNSGACFIREVDKKKLSALSRSDAAPQFVHRLALNPPPEISHSNPKHKDVRDRCVKYTVVSVICMLLLLLVAGVLLAYYYSSSCVHGLQCGDRSCVWESQWCDGVKDCPAGQDEANCVRLHGSSFLLQIYWTQTRTWRPVCSHGWGDLQGRSSCQDIGFGRGTYFKSGQQRASSNDGFLSVKFGSNPWTSVLQQLVPSKSCPDDSVVTLRCTDCGSRLNSSTPGPGPQLASVGSWPWQVSLQVAGSHRCGGAVISPRWVLTAAHCVAGTPRPADWAVYAEIVDPLGALFHPAYAVSRIVAHEGYDSLTRRNDVALMKLFKPLDRTASSGVRPVCLPNIGLNFSVPETSWITHFSPTATGDSGSLYLMETQVSLIGSAECNGSAALGGRMSPDMICARSTEPRAGVCHSDSGGPLVSLKHGLWWLIGNGIWGEHCRGQSKPGVYGNITFHLNWIHHQMKVKG
uniref:Transmembrane protease serine 2-like n=1 Tax=Kryptolebias marmoratus TaxID=37003 RepID=A0A3Q3EEM3_KRYMA